MYNKDMVECYWAYGCDGKLVSGMKMYSMTSVSLKVLIAVLETEWSGEQDVHGHLGLQKHECG